MGYLEELKQNTFPILPVSTGNCSLLARGPFCAFSPQGVKQQVETVVTFKAEIMKPGWWFWDFFSLSYYYFLVSLQLFSTYLNFKGKIVSFRECHLYQAVLLNKRSPLQGGSLVIWHEQHIIVNDPEDAFCKNQPPCCVISNVFKKSLMPKLLQGQCKHVGA